LHRTLYHAPIHGWARVIAQANWIHTLPVLIMFLCLITFYYQEHLLQNPTKIRFKQAFSLAFQRINKGKTQDSPEIIAGLLSEALSNYLADKLNRPSSGLTLKDVCVLIPQRFSNIPDGHIDQLKRLWKELEEFRFAPSNSRDSGNTDILQGVEELLRF